MSEQEVSTMEDIRNDFNQLKIDWASVYEKVKTTPQLYSPHVPYLSLDQLNEVIETLSHWFDRARTPTGFNPVFHLARGLAATSLASARASLKAIQSGQHGHFTGFVSSINQIIPALHTLLIYSSKEEGREAAEGLVLKLSESVALLNTAQTELKQKTDLLSRTQDTVDQIHEASEKIIELGANATEDEKAINGIKNTAEQELKDITLSQQHAKEAEKLTTDVLNKNTALQTQLEQQAKNLNVLNAKAKEQADLIEALLPSGANAGLASAFASRVRTLEWIKWLWAIIFISSILGLVYMVITFFGIPGASSAMPPEELWKQILHRLPLSAPLIWLGWFSAIQYGNTVRVQEDYAFKEATSKAFEGYRSHLEHIATVNLGDGRNAMTLLAAKTIEILAHEPLRVFQKSDKDVSPAHSILDRFFPTSKQPKQTDGE